MAPKGPASLKVLENALEDRATDLPNPVREMGAIYLDQIARLTEVIEQLADELEAASKTDVQLRRLCTIPGIGPVTAGAVAAFAPDRDTFDSGRTFAAWLGVRSVSRTDRVPARTATAEVHRRQDQARLSEQDGPDRHPPPADRRRVAPKARVIRWVVRKGGSTNRWLAALVARKPKMVAAVALANKMARMIWAMTKRQENYRIA